MKHIKTFENFLDHMSTFDLHIEESEILEITHSDYCSLLDVYVNENFLSNIGKDSLAVLNKLLGPLKDLIQQIEEHFHIGLSKIIEAFKQKSLFDFLKAIKFNLGLVLKAFKELTELIRKGLFKIFEKIVKTGIFEKLRAGSIKVDDFLDSYPILKKIGGLGIGALLIYMWLNMSFIGSFDYDFNWSDIWDAFMGKYSITQLFFSPAGLMLIALFTTGPYVSIPWLGSSLYSLVLAFFYTGYVKLKGSDKDVLGALKKLAKGGRT